MQNDLDSFWETQNEFIKTLSETHNISNDAAEKKVKNFRVLKKRRKPNAWNAWLHFKALETKNDAST